jgi:polysaccharide chain length determinant protein (PEP-CTERM system associated)
MKEFKLRQLNVSADGKDFYGRMGDATGQLNQARLELREAENSRDSYKRQLAGEEPGLIPEGNEAASGSTPVPEIDGRIDALKRQLDGMLQRYTEEHPDVVGTKRVIEQLEEQKKAELAMRRRAPAQGRTGPAPINSNPVYQQLKVSLAETEATVASLRTRVAEYESRMLRLQQSAKMVPQVEAEYAQLNRDYDINKKNYEGLVSRRESAEISGEMEASAGVADFRLIDPPRVSPQPVAPNRAVLFPLALLAAIAAGLAASFLASQIRPTFFEPLGLSQVSGLPVLGAVSMITGEEQRRRERRGLIGFISAVIAFLASFGGGLTALYLLSSRTV